MLDMFFEILGVMFNLVKPLVLAFGVCLLIFSALCSFWYFVYLKKGLKLPKRVPRLQKRTGLFKQLFYELPKRYVLDLFEREEDYFDQCGLHIFAGEQGSGKTIGAVEMILRLQKGYPEAKTTTNFGLVTEDREMDDWHLLLDFCNGKKGIIAGLDEIQTWFKSGNVQLPEEMLEIVCQNRKNRRVLIATSQVVTRMSKAIREQSTLIYFPYTFLGCFTVVFVKKPVIDAEGNIKSYKHRGMYSFVHTEELRNAYDTYKVIHTLSKDGFKEQLPIPTINNILVTK